MFKRLVQWVKGLFHKEQPVKKEQVPEIKSHVNHLDMGLRGVYKIMHKELSHPAKDFTLRFRSKTYFIYHAFDKKDQEKVERDKHDYIIAVMKHVMNKRLKTFFFDSVDTDHFEVYKMIEAHTWGSNPESMELKKEFLDKLRQDTVNDDEKYGKARPLDENSYQVKQQRNKND